MKVVLSPNPYRDRGLKAAQAAEKILRSVGVETVMCLPFQVEGSGLELPKHIRFKRTQEELKSADMLICFGGDGTILHAAKDANACHAVSYTHLDVYKRQTDNAMGVAILAHRLREREL